MKRGLQYYQKAEKVSPTDAYSPINPKTICAAIILIIAATVPLFIRNKKYRTLQQLLNVSVLGLWSGTFLSYSSIIGFLANGPQLFTVILEILIIVMAFIYPLFGKRTYYCTNVCPFGSAQALVSKCTKRKIRLGSRLTKCLNNFRRALWGILMISLLTGIGASWINYEPFSAFIFRSASTTAIVIAVLFLVLSLFIPRPYCRFVCPVGTLLRISQRGGHNNS